MEENKLEIFKEFFEWAERAYKEKSYTVAVSNYYKALAELCDYFLLKTTGFNPSNHSERFRLLHRNIPTLYKIADELFKFYRKTYSHISDQKNADFVRSKLIEAKKYVRID